MNYKITILLITFLIPLYCMAEYDEWDYEITIKTTEGKTFSGYGKRRIFKLDKDSLSNRGYLIDKLTNNNDSLFFYTKRISYKNTSELAPMQSREYLLFDKKGVLTNSIKNITVFNIEIGSTLSKIENKLYLRDTTWLKKQPLKIIHIKGYVCEFDIFVHEKNDDLSKIIDRMKMISEKYFNAENPEINTDEINQFFEEIKKMQGMKVVVFSFCTC
jgi:methyl-accepting chemotaxis protein